MCNFLFLREENNFDIMANSFSGCFVNIQS
jgi:hypothetical protein